MSTWHQDKIEMEQRSLELKEEEERNRDQERKDWDEVNQAIQDAASSVRFVFEALSLAPLQHDIRYADNKLANLLNLWATHYAYHRPGVRDDRTHNE